MKIAVFWDLRLCSLIALMMEAVSTSEMSVNFYETARCNIPEESHLVLTCSTGKLFQLMQNTLLEYCPVTLHV
jgi:hypothetical protein